MKRFIKIKRNVLETDLNERITEYSDKASIIYSVLRNRYLTPDKDEVTIPYDAEEISIYTGFPIASAKIRFKIFKSMGLAYER